MSSPLPRRQPRHFDPERHRRELQAILGEIRRAPRLDARGLDRILRRHPKDGRGLFSRSDLIAGCRRFGGPTDAELVERLRLRPVRTLSGVTPVTVLTKPYPCPGRCIFCPNDVRMPKSYLADEPGAQRAEDNGFDPYLQTWNRLAAFRGNGHPVDKIELILLGGTWSFHPEPYQIWFVKRCFDALNDFGAGHDGRGHAGAAPARYASLRRADPGSSYNRVVGDHLAGELGGAWLHPSEDAGWAELAASQRRNETAACRSVGLVMETRPDYVTAGEALRLRRLGATKVQLGIQSLSDRVLEANRRGHDVAATRRALRVLRGAGFKLHAHWMPNLLGSNPADDAADFARLFQDRDFRPDELKIYPCSLVESAELMGPFRRGEWRPYDGEELLALLADCLGRTPPWCRLTRVIREFSAGEIVAGSRVTNLREVAERLVEERGQRRRDIRAREIRDRDFRAADLALGGLRYATSIGEEHFLEFTTPDDRLVAFLRLSLPRERAPIAELEGRALIREVHVYGASLALGSASDGRPQHAGLGRRLIEAAARIARDAGFASLAVISAVGTREYYRGLGFRDGELYQELTLA